MLLKVSEEWNRQTTVSANKGCMVEKFSGCLVSGRNIQLELETSTHIQLNIFTLLYMLFLSEYTVSLALIRWK